MSQTRQGDDLYCKLFVSGAGDEDALTAAVDEITRGAVMPGQGPGNPALDITVHAQARHMALDDEQDDFVLWRHYLDIEAVSGDTAFGAYQAELVRLIVGLRARGLRVVAACDFEDTLNEAVRAATSARPSGQSSL